MLPILLGIFAALFGIHATATRQYGWSVCFAGFVVWATVEALR